MDPIEIRPGSRERHPWELARAACLLGMLEKRKFETVGDIGAGDLFFARELLSRHPARFVAVDKGYKRVTEPDGILLLTSLSDVADNSLDLAFLMDVLEHAQDDRQLSGEVFRKLKRGGCLLLTVPGHAFLFSAHDVFLRHVRRYSRHQLHALLQGLDAEIEQSFHFFTSLFLIRCGQILLAKLRVNALGRGAGGWTLPAGHPVTRCLVALLKADFALNKRLASIGLQLPGLSLCLIARKASAS